MDGRVWQPAEFSCISPHQEMCGILLDAGLGSDLKCNGALADLLGLPRSSLPQPVLRLCPVGFDVVLRQANAGQAKHITLSLHSIEG